MSSCRRPPAPRLDPGTKIYYQRIESILEEENERGRGSVYLKNVIDQVVTDGTRLVSCDKDGSKALEMLLRHQAADSHSLKKIMKALKPDFFKLCVNRCGSHVVQALLESTGCRICQFSTSLSADNSFDCELVVLFSELVGVVQEKLLDCMKHPYASHVLCSLLQVLGGVRLPEKLERSRYSLEFRTAKMANVKSTEATKVRNVPTEFEKLFERFFKDITKLEKLSDLMIHQNGSLVIQTLVRVVAKCQPAKVKKIIKKLVKLSGVLWSVENTDTIPDVFTDLVGSHLMEAVVQLAPEDLQQEIFDTCFRGRVVACALHPVANFPLQQLISTSSPGLLVAILEELTDLEEVLFVGHTGLVVQLVQAAVKFPDLQLTSFSRLQKAFHTEAHPKCVAQVLLPLVTYEIYAQGCKVSKEKDDGDSKQESGGDAAAMQALSAPTLQGSLLLQALLKYEDTTVVARSLLRYSMEDLLRLCCDPCASHVLTTFFTSSNVASKKKDRMTSKLLPTVVPLCLDKHGSHVVDALWQQITVKKKKEMAAMLVAHEEKLSADFYGSIILRNCSIAGFKSNHDIWLKDQAHSQLNQEESQSLLEPSATRRRKRSVEMDTTLVTHSKKTKKS